MFARIFRDRGEDHGSDVNERATIVDLHSLHEVRVDHRVDHRRDREADVERMILLPRESVLADVAALGGLVPVRLEERDHAIASDPRELFHARRAVVRGSDPQNIPRLHCEVGTIDLFALDPVALRHEIQDLAERIVSVIPERFRDHAGKLHAGGDKLPCHNDFLLLRFPVITIRVCARFVRNHLDFTAFPERYHGRENRRTFGYSVLGACNIKAPMLHGGARTR